MHIERAHSWKKLGVQCLLLALPTIFFAFAVLMKLNANFVILQNQWIYQGAYFSVGILLSLVFYSWRFRFISTALVLALLYYLGYKILEQIAVGEFDIFFFSVQYLIFVFIFSIGWLVGFGFSRWRFFTVVWVLFLLAIEIIIVSKITTVTAGAIALGFIPVLLYTFYIIYASELIRNLNEHQSSFRWYLTKRVSGFFGVIILIFAVIFYIFRKDFTAIENAWKKVESHYNDEKSNSQRMTKVNRDGTLSHNGKMPLSGSLSKTKQLVFVAHLNNFFSDGSTQNPLYFTADYYTRFDSVTQTFATDTLRPYNDLFSPDPSQISLYFTKTDSTAIWNSLATKNRKVVEADIYKVALSPTDYLAPSTAFSIQPIPVPYEYTSQYTAAYHAKMWVSDLNSAYFVYNPAGNTMLEDFQKTRYAILRKDSGYNGIDNAFLAYYTKMPEGKSYQRIQELASTITAADTTAIDKVLAIRNYFLSKDEFGQPLYQYTDNPGEPGLPGANKLDYFLFTNHKGYCAYFAGATLFMLRALHIPSRIATGFLTVDRSSKNPGWYWFYEDQAHAWVQVFFKDYGWIDFDTTIPDVNTQQAPQPDGTPPLGSQKVAFVGDGSILKVDTLKKQLLLSVSKILYKDKSFQTNQNPDIRLNIAFAKIFADTGTVNIGTLEQGLHITAASYDEKLAKLSFEKAADTAVNILSRLPQPVSIDEIKIIKENKAASPDKNTTRSYLHAFNWLSILISLAAIALLCVILIILSPWLIWRFFNWRARKNLHFKQRAILYLLNQMGYPRNFYSPEDFARQMDKQFGSNLVRFTTVYQKEKYSHTSPDSQEIAAAAATYKPFVRSVKTQIPWKKRVILFLNFYHTLHFFIKNH